MMFFHQTSAESLSKYLVGSIHCCLWYSLRIHDSHLHLVPHHFRCGIPSLLCLFVLPLARFSLTLRSEISFPFALPLARFSLKQVFKPSSATTWGTMIIPLSPLLKRNPLLCVLGLPYTSSIWSNGLVIKYVGWLLLSTAQAHAHGIPLSLELIARAVLLSWAKCAMDAFDWIGSLLYI